MAPTRQTKKSSSSAKKRRSSSAASSRRKVKQKEPAEEEVEKQPKAEAKRKTQLKKAPPTKEPEVMKEVVEKPKAKAKGRGKNLKKAPPRQEEPEEMEEEVGKPKAEGKRKGKATKESKKPPPQEVPEEMEEVEKPKTEAKGKAKKQPKKSPPQEDEEHEEHMEEEVERPKAGARGKRNANKDPKREPTKPKKDAKKPKSKGSTKQVKPELTKPDASQANFRGRDQASELKFGALEIVVAVGDLDASEPYKKFLVGRLQEDVWMGSDKQENLMISWFDRSDDDERVWEAEDTTDLIPAGSLVCSINKHVKEGIKVVKDGDEKGTYEILRVAKGAFLYAEKKLKEQLQDDYDSDNDSQFGDAMVFKRLAYQGKGAGGVKTIKMEVDSTEDDGGGAASGHKRKRKGVAGASKKKSRTLRGLTPRPTFKEATDPFSIKTGKIADFDGDMERASREVVRAVRCGDLKALKSAVKSNRIATMHYRQSTGLPITPLMWAVTQSSMDAVRILLEDLKEKADSKRPNFQSCALPTLTTGRISGKHANYNRRKINASRGGKEGNNALLYDAYNDRYKTDTYLNEKAMPMVVGKPMPDNFEWNVLRDFDEISSEILDMAEAKFDRSYVSQYAHVAFDEMARGGHRKMLERYIKQQKDHAFDSNAFNFLHLESLADAPEDRSKPFSKEILSRSVAKKGDSADSRFSPLACACINPDPVFLKAMLSVAREHAGILDSKETSLMHYAAACEGPEPLKYLIESHSLSRTAADKRKETPIHCAARAGRYENVRVLLNGVEPDELKIMLSAKSTQGYAAIHYAAQTRRSGGLETLRALLEAGADVNMPSTAARNKVMPVHIAAAVGDSDALKLLIEHGCSIVKGDKLGRTPLIHACLNGQAHVVSKLLIAGVSVETADSSDNQPIHYAAAYGWDECVELLLEAGAIPDAKNSWKTTPLSVSIQKGRHQVSTRLLKLPSVDVNFKDDEGKTLFFRLVETYVATTLVATSATPFVVSDKKKNKNKKSEKDDADEEIHAVRNELPWALQKLLDRDDLDVATTDSGSVNVLHLLCSQDYPAGGSGQMRAVALIKLILSVGDIDVDAPDAEGMPPLLYTAVAGNSILLEYLLSKGAKLSESTVDKDGKNICHHLVGAQPHKCEKQLLLVEKSIGADVYAKLLSAADGEGYNPIHRAFVVMVNSLKSDKEYDAAQNLLKGILTRFSELAVSEVQSTAIFDNAKDLALVLTGEDEDVEEQNNAYHRRNRHNKGGLRVLSGGDRMDGKKIRDALGDRNAVVPVAPEDFGKSVIHLVCTSKHPHRTRAVLEWLVPISGEVLDNSAGQSPDAMTPLQVLLYEVLPGHLIPENLLGSPVKGRLQRPTAGAPGRLSGPPVNKPRLRCLDDVLKCVKFLLKDNGGDINSEPPRPFMDEEDRKNGEASFSEEMDSEAVKGIKRLAALVNSNPAADSSGKELLEAFRDLMAKRGMRKRASTKEKCVAEPLATLLARGGASKVPVEIWDKLVSQCGMDLARCDQLGDSALHIALRLKDESLSKYLCNAHSKLISQPNKQGERPIHVVAKGDDAKFLKLVLERLVDKGAEANQGDNQGRTAFHFSVERAACRSGEPLEQCELILLRAGARLDVAEKMNTRTPLHFCFLEGASNPHEDFPHHLRRQQHDRVELVSALLAAKGADKAVTMADNAGRTPLFYAAAYNSTVSSLLLVSKGAGLFETDQDGNTPVNIAILRGHASYAITMLKSMGAASNLPELVDVVDVRREPLKEGDAAVGKMKVVSRTVKSIVWHAIKQNFRGLVYILLDTAFPLYRAAVDALSLGSYQLVRKLLTTSPPEVVQHINPHTGCSLLHEIAAVKRYANSEWSTTLAEILLESGVSSSSLAKDGQSALHIAAMNGHMRLIKLLVASDEKVISTVDRDGHLPLGRFMRALPNLSLAEAKCVEMLDHLTGDAVSLSERQYNRVPRTKKDSREISYSGITFAPGPNRNTVAEEISRQSTLLGKKKEEDKVEGFSTLLIQALKAQKPKLVQELIRRGSPIDMLDSGGLSPLHHAILSDSFSAAVLLLRNGANPNVLSGDARGVTPLVTAVFRCSKSTDRAKTSLDLIKLLLRYGADVIPACKVSGGTALHFACRENNLELAQLLMRAALHSSDKPKSKIKKKAVLKNGQTLVRFHGDCALYPARINGGTVEVWSPEKCVMPASRVEESFGLGDAALDSLDALVALQLKSRAKPQVDTPIEGNDSFKGRSEVNGWTPANVGTLPPMTVPARPSRPAGHDDEDSDDVIEEDDEEEDEEDEGDTHGSMDAEDNTSGDAKKTNARNTLKKYYGSESLLLGETNKNLTAPIAKGSVVILQLVDSERGVYADTRNMWLEGRVLEQWANGTYDVDLRHGPVVEGVTRQALRPWKANFAWPAPGDKPSKTLKALLACRDKKGHTPLQAAVKPTEFGSFENIHLVDTIIGHGGLPDQETVALCRPGSLLAKRLADLCTSAMELSDLKEESVPTNPPGLEPIPSEQLEKDSKQALISLEQKGVLKRKKITPEILPACEMKAVGRRVLPVANDREENSETKHYGVVMAKVEMTHYGYSENKYYKMQIVEDPTKGLFVLVTNWGQVGDYGGQKQQTPFGSRDEAIKEFRKVFKSKTGNQWDDYLAGAFAPKLGKYKPMKLLPKGFEKPELPNLANMVLEEDEYPDVFRTSALSTELTETMMAFADPAKVNRAAATMGLQQERLPLGKISIQTILEAEDKLKEVEAAVKRTLHAQDDLEKKRQAQEEVAILSSQYFELLPTKEGDNALAPLDEASLKIELAHILSLKELTVASQIITTASVKATELNPLDYVYKAMNASMSVLEMDTAERIGVEQYFRNTAENTDYVVNQVYRLHRMDEKSNRRMENHRLLWHGTQVANMLGVIKEGLRVAPPTAEIAGNAFGDGVYFADMASKSIAYCRAHFDCNAKEMPRAYLFLADVALGRQEKVTDPDWGEKEADPETNSIWAIGYEGPDVRKDIVFSETGIVLPLGHVCRVPSFTPKSEWKKSRWEEVQTRTSEAIEEARNSRDTKFPAIIRSVNDDVPVDIHLEHGKNSKVAKVVPVRKKKESGSNKKRKGNDGQAVEEEADDAENDKDEEEEDDDEDAWNMQEYTIERSKKSLHSHIHHNEYVVRDTDRINLRYIVEVTSRAWLKNQAKKVKKKNDS